MLNIILEFLKVYWLDILIVLLFIGALIFLYKKGKMDLIRKIILALVIQAEKSLGAGTGELKYAMVVERAYNVLPVAVKWLITKRELDELIEEAVVYLKTYLAEGRDLRGYEKEFKQIIKTEYM